MMYICFLIAVIAGSLSVLFIKSLIVEHSKRISYAIRNMTYNNPHNGIETIIGLLAIDLWILFYYLNN